MATKVLSMKRTIIVGQAATDIPLWRCEEKTYMNPYIAYFVFPGMLLTIVHYMNL
ncbi:hypothetical protein CC78DRAFT_536822 [Lojkania enalia]|uniref:Uncharacterized protein n=1 Tax=Lojkania enalia TaxID=147567 RepID=A0A9P4K2Q9_9PLEO|nr:hypothetical protein CC78DRAFT_536822 [Didymosphaeria enalia]